MHLNIHFKTKFSDSVMVMSEEDMDENTVAELGITEFWLEPCEQDIEASINI